MARLIMRISVLFGVVLAVFVMWLSVTTNGVASSPVVDKVQRLDVPYFAERNSLLEHLIHVALRLKRQVSGGNVTTSKPEITTKTEDIQPPVHDNKETLDSSTGTEAPASGNLPAEPDSSKTDSGDVPVGIVTEIPTHQPDVDSNVDRKLDSSLSNSSSQITSLTGASAADLSPVDKDPEGKVPVKYLVTPSTQSDSNSDKADSVNETGPGVNPANPKPNTTTQAASPEPTTAKVQGPKLGEIKDTVEQGLTTPLVTATTTSTTTTTLPSTEELKAAATLPVVPLAAVNETTVGSIAVATTNTTVKLHVPTTELMRTVGEEDVAPPPPTFPPELANKTEAPVLMPANLVIPNNTTTTTTSTTTSVSMATEIPAPKLLNATHFELAPAAIREPASTDQPASNTTTKTTDVSADEPVPPLILPNPVNETKSEDNVANITDVNTTKSVLLPGGITSETNTTKAENVTEAPTPLVIPALPDSNSTFHGINITTTTAKMTTIESTQVLDVNITEESNETLTENISSSAPEAETFSNVTEAVNVSTEMNITPADNVSVAVIPAVTERSNLTNVTTTTAPVNLTLPGLTEIMNVTNATTTTAVMNITVPEIPDIVNVTNATTTTTEVMNITVPEIPDIVNVSNATTTTTEVMNITVPEMPDIVNVTNATRPESPPIDTIANVTMVTEVANVTNTTIGIPVLTNATLTTTESVNLTSKVFFPVTTKTTTTHVPNTTLVQNISATPPTTTLKTTLQKISVILTKSSTTTTTTLSTSTIPTQTNNSAAVGQSQGLSASALTAIITGSIIGFWIILGPIICLICKVRDKRKERYHTRLTNHSDPPADNGMLDAMIISELKKTSESSHDNGTTREKEKEYNTVANDKEETEKLRSNIAEHEF